ASCFLEEEEARNKVMDEKVHIHTWSCSYYLNSEKQWVSGKLLLTPVSVKFTADKSGEVLASFPLSSISEIKKESSTLIFSSLTILESSTKHWFSSLQPNRNVIFNVLEHFWREQLLSPDGARAQTACVQTPKGKELTGLLMGSQKRLEDTSKVLEHQGEQFDNIMKGLDKIESEMDVADRYGGTPGALIAARAVSEAGKATEKPAAPPSGSKDGVLVQIPVIVTERADTHAKPGSLSLLVSGLRICGAKAQLLHWFEKQDVDEVRVHSPYEICVRQRFIGKPDICYQLLSAKMPEAIPFLEMQYSKKIQFLQDAAFLVPASLLAATGFVGSLVQSGSTPSSSGGSADSQQAQMQKEKQIVSQSEMQEIRQILRRLKCLALETETELERQDESLDAITSSVDQANMSIDRHNRRIRKLT
ncbi:hypothetical protein Chor_005774, partial [Crotalus horridus]